LGSKAIWPIFLTASVLVVLAAPFFGLSTISPLSLLKEDESVSSIFWNLRVPRVLVAFLVGASLSLGGIVFQSVFKNELASPFTLGVTSGAAFGVAVYYQLGIALSVAGLSGSTIFSMAGAAAAILIVYSLSVGRMGLSPIYMLLAGVVVSFFFSSLILFLQYISDFTQVFRISRWLMGSIDGAPLNAWWHLLIIFIPAALVIFMKRDELNLLLLGEELAQSKGLNIKAARLVFFVIVSLLVGLVVSVCGPIGFIGIMVPHIARLLVGHDHRYLVPFGLILGGVFLTICDLIARVIIAPYEMPVGVITALLGGPFFLWMLFHKISLEQSR